MSDRSERFVEQGFGFPVSPCMSCVHKHAGAATCEAFPDGIPMEMLDGTNQHREPYDGDNGIQYEPET